MQPLDRVVNYVRSVSLPFFFDFRHVLAVAVISLSTNAPQVRGIHTQTNKSEKRQRLYGLCVILPRNKLIKEPERKKHSLQRKFVK